MAVHESIQYRPGTAHIAYFPSLDSGDLLHGFTWGSQENMAFSWEQSDEGRQKVRERYEKFRLNVGMSYLPLAVSLEPTTNSLDLVYINHDHILQHIQSQIKKLVSQEILYPEPIHVEGNFVFTQALDISLFVKPGDCPCAIIYYHEPGKKRFIGLMHAGRDQLDNYLPEIVFDYFIHDLGCNPEFFSIGIGPGIGKDRYTIRNEDYHLLRNWHGWKRYMTVGKDRMYLDLNTRIRDAILESGVPDQNIIQYEVDTYKAASEGIGFSHRYATETNSLNGRFIIAAQLT